MFARKLQSCLVTSHLNATVCGPFQSSAAARYPEGLSRGSRPQTQADVCGRRARAARVGDASVRAHRAALTASQACVGGRGSGGERPLAPLAALSGAGAATRSLWYWREAPGRLSSSGAQSSPGRREALTGVSQKQAKPGQPDPRTMGPFSHPLRREAGRHDNHPVIESQGRPRPRRSPRAPCPLPPPPAPPYGVCGAGSCCQKKAPLCLRGMKDIRSASPPSPPPGGFSPRAAARPRGPALRSAARFLPARSSRAALTLPPTLSHWKSLSQVLRPD